MRNDPRVIKAYLGEE
ncbi:hypothetical protein ACUTF1_28975 [Burkholderia pseudomallei]